MKKVKVITFGCKVNRYESQVYINQLDNLRFTSEENVYIVNTCSVTEKAQKNSLLQVKKILKDPLAKVFVTGCASKIFENLDLKNLVIIPNKDKEKLTSYIMTNDLSFKVDNFSQTRAFIKVQDGCNNLCSYCIIPHVRGRSFSRKIQDVLEEINFLIEKGFKEFVLTGINIGDYKDGERGLCFLLKKILEIKKIQRLRISSINPDNINGEFIEISKDEKFCSSMHISLQSGSDKVLKEMRRNYLIKDFLKIINKLSKRKNFIFTTDMIVGFPREENKDFQKSLEIIEEVDFSKVHIFSYSKRPDTLASLWPEIDRNIVLKRKDKMTFIANKKAFEVRGKFVGEKLNVLVETKENGFSFGYSENFLPVKVKGIFPRNEVISVKIVKNDNNGLIGDRN